MRRSGRVAACAVLALVAAEGSAQDLARDAMATGPAMHAVAAATPAAAEVAVDAGPDEEASPAPAAATSAPSSRAIASADPTPRLAPVVATATRTSDDPRDVPASIDVVDGATLRLARPALSLAETLPRVPGLVVRDRQNQAQDLQLSIRGFGARASFGVRGVRLYTDGIPATMPDGQGQVSHFALEAADRIEVLRGPFSALYGNAAGGVVATFSEPPPPSPEFAAGVLGGSDGLWRAGASWRGPITDGHGLRVDAARTAGDGYRDHSAWRRDSAQAFATGDLGRGTYTLLANHLALRAEDPQGLTAAELAGNRRAASPGALQFGTRKTVRQQQIGGRVEQPLGDAHTLQLLAYGGERRTFQMLSVPIAAQANPAHGGGVIDLDRGYHGADVRWQWRGETVTLTAGLAADTADERRRGFENVVAGTPGIVGRLRRDEDNTVRGRDAYLQADWRPSPRWRINAGLRHSRVRFASDDRYIAAGNPDDSGAMAYARTSPVLGVLWHASDAWVLYANAGHGFETPTFAELAYRADGGSGLNDGLRAARSRHAEVGARWRRGGIDASLALFQSRTRDELVVRSTAGGRSVFANAALSRRRGAELALRAELADNWTLSTAWTWLDARHLRDVPACAAPPCAAPPLIQAGRHIPGLARHTLWSELRWRAGPQTDVLMDARASSRVFANDANTAAAPGHALLGLGIEHRVATPTADWRLFARVDNLLDRDTVGSVIVNDANGRFFEPAPGRTWQLGMTATWR